MLSASLVLAAAVSPAPLPMAWAQFSRSGALSHVSETVDIATGDRNDDARFRYKLRFTREAFGTPPEVKWADSKTCPAVRAVVASMRDVAMPSPAPYGVPGGSEISVLDGTEYYLAAPSSDSSGKITISSNIGSPLATWIDTSFERLASCWTTTAP